MSASPIFNPGKRRGVALILTLVLLAITSLMLVAFMTTAGIDRTATFSYSQSLKAEQVGLGALQLVIGQLQLEMAKDALADTGNGAYPLRPVYTNITTTNALPQPVGTNTAMPLLVKTSATNFPFTGTRLKGTLTASTLGSTESSQNGRSMPLSRWNQAYLGTFPSTAAAPHWVLMTRAGPTNGVGMSFGTGSGTLNNASAANDQCAIGRFAYAVYDVGGLVDITAAGHPTSLPAAQLQAIKGTLAGANLAVLGIDPDKLVSWRNAGTTATYADYVTNTTTTNGFLRVAANDTTFLGRQDLINAAKQGIAGLTTASLTNLTVFSRTQDAPSWVPTLNASAMGGLNGGGNRYAYADNALSPLVGAITNMNRAVPAVRRPGTSGASITVASYRNDGSSSPYTVAAGDPLVARRFPLGRLSWITPTGPKAGISDTAIQACFGLKWLPSTDPNMNGASVWKYVGPTGTTESSTIESLDQIAAESGTTHREANFFELLQAGVLTGSLGVDAGMTDYNLSNLYQTNPTLQLFRIGAAIIDQTTSAAIPTVIEYNQGGTTWQAVGVKNLPHANSLQPVQVASPDNPSATACYLLFTFWNPNQGTGATARPKVRLRVQGTMAMASKAASTTAYPSPPVPNYGPGYILKNIDTSLELATGAGVGVNGFTGTSATQSLLPTPGDVNTAVNALPLSGAGNANTAVNSSPDAATSVTWVQLPVTEIANYVPGKSAVGLRLPDLLFDLNNANSLPDSAPGVSAIFGSTVFNSSKPFSISMEFWNGNAWIPYQYFEKVNGTSTWTGAPGGYTGPFAVSTSTVTIKSANTPKITFQPKGTFAVQTFMKLGNDPRSTRFGSWLFCPPRSTASTAFYQPLLWGPNASSFSGGYGGVGSAYIQFYPTNFMSSPGGSFYNPATLSRNNTKNVTPTSSYTDLDGVNRIGDSGLAPTTAPSSQFNPFSRVSDRPVILNRPFYSVAELGYALRDNPWRSLDFFSTNSADSALLDLFTVSDATTNGVVAGRIDLNSRSAAALASVLADTTIADPAGDPAVPVTTITTNNAVTLAAAMTNFTALPGGALVSRDQAATRLSPSLTTGFATTDDQYIKVRREALARALTDVGQTRTWNLMIDLVAQTGRYPATAKQFSDFIVEGERRYWLHVAIDRVTGRVIDHRLEVVSP